MKLTANRAVAAISCLASLLLLVAPLQGQAEKKVSITLGGLTVQAPEGWKQGKPKSRLRLAEFSVPRVKDDSEDGELVISFFGGDGGGVEANVERWVAQFKAEGRTQKKGEGKGAAGAYVLLELTGTYKQPVGPPVNMETKDREQFAMIAAILQTPEGNYFIKLTAPRATAKARRDALVAFIESARMATEGEKK